MRIVFASGLCLALTTTAGWGQTPDQSPSGWFRVSMEPTIGQLVVDAVLIVAVAIVLGWGRRRAPARRPASPSGADMWPDQACCREADAGSASADTREKDGVKPVVTVLVALAITAFAATAFAHVVEITTSIAAEQPSDDDLRAAVESAINDAVHHAIAFTPTVVALQNVRRVGDRIYFVLLIVDHDGEELVKRLATDEANDSSEPLQAPDPEDAKTL